MLARLILALLLALGAIPAVAMPAACHDDPAMHALMTTGHAPDRHRHHAPAVEHACLGCATLGVPDHARIAAPRLAAVVVPAARVAPLMLGAAPAPMLRPPRRG